MRPPSSFISSSPCKDRHFLMPPVTVMPGLTRYAGIPCLDDPYITIVGGTTLTMNGTGASYASEKVWNWGFAGEYNWNTHGYVGSSGGISSYLSHTELADEHQHDRQQRLDHHAECSGRGADSGQCFCGVHGGGQCDSFGGTSCAAPLWAGFMALVNQQAAANGLAPLGFINPALYAIAAGPNYTNCFHDTTTGNNIWPGSPNLFYAVTGYDLCTGLGTPNGTNLINALAARLQSRHPYFPAAAALWHQPGRHEWRQSERHLVALCAGRRAFRFRRHFQWLVLTLTTASPVGFAADNQLSMTGLRHDSWSAAT